MPFESTFTIPSNGERTHREWPAENAHVSAETGLNVVKVLHSYMGRRVECACVCMRVPVQIVLDEG